MHIRAQTQTHTHTGTHPHTHTHTGTHTHTHTHIRTHKHTHAGTHTRTHTHTHTRAHTRTHTLAHTHRDMQCHHFLTPLISRLCVLGGAVLFTDSFDSFVFAEEQEIVEKFRQMQSPMVVSAEVGFMSGLQTTDKKGVALKVDSLTSCRPPPIPSPSITHHVVDRSTAGQTRILRPKCHPQAKRATTPTPTVVATLVSRMTMSSSLGTVRVSAQNFDQQPPPFPDSTSPVLFCSACFALHGRVSWVHFAFVQRCDCHSSQV